MHAATEQSVQMKCFIFQTSYIAALLVPLIQKLLHPEATVTAGITIGSEI